MRDTRRCRAGRLLAFFCLALPACAGNITGGGDPAPTGEGPGATPGRPPGAAPPSAIVSQPGASSRFVRLTHQQWENTVRDLLGLPAPSGLSATFVAEPLRSTFDTNGSLLSVPPDLWHDYQTAAEMLATRVAHDAKLLAGLVPGAAPADPRGRARAFVENLGLRGYRRPLGEAELNEHLALFDRGAALIGSGDPFADGAELVLSAVLQSPFFLYRTELGTRPAGGKLPLDDYEIASRLSYGLTSTMPDPGLLAAAAARRLQTRAGLLAEVDRLLETPAARATVADFHGQLLGMREYQQVKKDERQLPAFAQVTGADLQEEALAFVRNTVFERNLGLTELLTAPFTFANSRIARLYGLPVPADRSDPFVRVELDPGQRAGLLTQIGFLAANGEGDVPSTIMRGVRVARSLLCVDIPPPPDAVPPLPAIAPGSTNRQRVEQLTSVPPCNACHTTFINPPGYALEALDGAGRFRTTENGRPVDARGSYQLDGAAVTFDGPVQLARTIAASQQAHDCYARRWVEYLYGRDLDPAQQPDRDLISQAGLISRQLPSARRLIRELIATDAFVTRLP
jgi:hypothetical protein